MTFRTLAYAFMIFFLAAIAVLPSDTVTVALSINEGTNMAAALSPDGKLLLIDHLGILWGVPATRGPAHRITGDFEDARQPAWSPDGKTIAFQSYRDGGWHIWSIRPDGSGLKQLTAGPFDDREPQYSHDGTRIAFSSDRNGNYDIWVMDLKTGRAAARTNQPSNESMPAWSPDGSQMAAVIEGTLWVVPVDARGQPNGKPRQLTTEIADAPSWSGDSKQILYLSNNHLRLISAAGGAPREIPVNLTWKLKKPEGRTVIHASHLFDGRTPNLRDNVDIVIEGNRIVSVEAHRMDLHTSNVVDAEESTVMPGLIESHAHLNAGYGEKLGRIFLGYGITTVRNPATNPYAAMENREPMDAGVRLGPRVFTTGYTFDGARIYYSGGGTMHDERQVDRGLGGGRALGYDFVKTYVRLPDSLQKRVIGDAHAHGIWVTSHELYPAVAFGADAVEHIRGTSRRGYSPKVTAMNY